MAGRRFRTSTPTPASVRRAGPLLTGRYPDRVGVPGVLRPDPDDSWGYLSAKATLLPQVLKTAGYYTALVGKWHLGLEEGNNLLNRGFDFFHGFLGDRMDYWTHLCSGQNFMRLNRQVVDPQGHATEFLSNGRAHIWKIRQVSVRPVSPLPRLYHAR